MNEKGQGSGAKGQGYRQLLAWQRSHELALAAFRSTQTLARKESWLYRQCMRPTVSVAANIAEGYSRGSLREYIQFLNIARGSLAETEYYLLFIREAGLLPEAQVRALDVLRAEAASLLLGLIRSLQAKDTSSRRQVGRIGEGQAEYAASLLDDNGLDP